MRFSSIFALCLLSVFLVACGDKKSDIGETRPPNVLYAEADGQMQEKLYKTAAEKFQQIEQLYPYSPEATRAQLMAGYAFYRDGKYDDAEIALERFVKLHPAHKDVPYAYYLRAICYYEQITDIARDQKITEEALAALREVAQRFPETSYARDAKIKIDLTQDHLAGKQLEIGRFYQKRQDYVAAINRFRDVVERYQTTSQVPEALHRLVETYLMLGITAEAQKYASVLGHNYPDSAWYKRSFALLGKNAPQPEQIKDEKTIGLF